MYHLPYGIPYGVPAGVYGGGGGGRDVGIPIDTIMMANMSMSTTEEQLVTIMNGFAGYKRSKLINNGKFCSAWVQFEDVRSAEAAITSLHGSSTLALDAQGLRVAFSKKPMGVPGRATVAGAGSAYAMPAAAGYSGYEDPTGVSKRSREASYTVPSDAMKRAATVSGMQSPQLPYAYAPPNFYAAGYAAGSGSAGMYHPSMQGMQASPYSLPYAATYGAAMPPPAHYHTPSYMPAPADGGPSRGIPIDTIMISNMCLGASEEDLTTIMNGFAGYKRSKLINNGMFCTAWVQFEDVKSAEAAITSLHGSTTLALDAQGLRVAFSKKPMGVPGRATVAGAGSAYATTTAGHQPRVAANAAPPS